MSWRDKDCVCEGVRHIVDAFKDELPCKAHVWNENGDKECCRCPVHYYDEISSKDCCHIRNTYYAIEKLDG